MQLLHTLETIFFEIWRFEENTFKTFFLWTTAAVNDLNDSIFVPKMPNNYEQNSKSVYVKSTTVA